MFKRFLLLAVCLGSSWSLANPHAPFEMQDKRYNPSYKHSQANNAPNRQRYSNPTIVGSGQQEASSQGGNWSQQVQTNQLVEEVQQLRGMVEELRFELNKMRENQRSRYIDLDTRINHLNEKVKSTSGQSIKGNTLGSTVRTSTSTIDQKALYQKAQKDIQNKNFNDAIDKLDQLEAMDPQGPYVPYVYYWKGELYMVPKLQDLDKSKVMFVKLLSNYPNHIKVPDALFKLGKTFSMQGEKAKAKSTLDKLVKEHPNSQAANLAKILLKEL